MSKPARLSGVTTSWRSYTVALRRRGSLPIWIDPEMERLAVPQERPGGRRGRPATCPWRRDPDLPHARRALFRLPLKQAEGLAASLLELAGLDLPVPNVEPRSPGAGRV